MWMKQDLRFAQTTKSMEMYSNTEMRCNNHQFVVGKLQKIVSFSRRLEKEFTTNGLNLLAYERVKRKQDEHVVRRNGLSFPSTIFKLSIDFG